MKEIWKETKYPGYYVSTFGNFKGPTCKIRKLSLSPRGYLYTNIRLNGKTIGIRINRIVAETFIPNPNNYPQVNHIDGNKQNNCVENLEWCDGSYNTRHAYVNGLAKAKRGWNHPNSKLTKSDINYIKTNYKPKDRIFGARALGRKFNVPHSTIVRICQNFYYYDCDHKITNKISYR